MSVNISEILQTGGDITPSDVSSTKDWATLFRAVQARRVNVLESGQRLIVTPTKQSIRAVNRQRRSERANVIEGLVLEAVKFAPPVKIGYIVKHVQQSLKSESGNNLRGEVLAACRSLRDKGQLSSVNKGESNFHMSWGIPTGNSSGEQAEPSVDLPDSDSRIDTDIEEEL